MSYDITSIGQLVDALGGPTKLGRDHGVTASNIANWSLRGYIPPAWHLRLYLELRKRNLTADPDLFEMTPEQARLAFPKRKNACAVVAA